MNFTKSLTVNFLFISLLTSTAVFSNDNNETEQLKRTSAEVGYKHPYVPGIALGLTVTKFFKEKPLRRFAAFATIAAAGTVLCQSFCEKYLDKNLSCFEWMMKKPAFKVKFEEFKGKADKVNVKVKEVGKEVSEKLKSFFN